MYEGVDFEKDLAAAEAALKTAEETFGPDHVNVSYALDKVSKLLRSKGVRTLDAVNLEARAKQIRIKANKDHMSSLTSEQREISANIKVATVKQDKAKSRNATLAAVFAVVCLLVTAKLFLAPTASERKMTQNVLASVKQMMPTTVLQHMVDTGMKAADEAKAAGKKHSDQLDSYMGSELPSQAASSP
jgi:hypothetical protein